MAEHRITAHVPSHKLENTDLEITVRSDDQLLGVLLIRQGAIVWRPTFFTRAFSVKWEDFDDLMKENGKKIKP